MLAKRTARGETKEVREEEALNMHKSKEKVRDIGVPGVEPPKKTCTDPNCPFHGSLPVRGRLMQGIVTSTKMHNAVTYRQDYLSLVAKYSRYERRKSNKHAHLPPCIEVNEGDIVRVAECRPISKTVKGVVISVKRAAANQEE